MLKGGLKADFAFYVEEPGLYCVCDGKLRRALWPCCSDPEDDAISLRRVCVLCSSKGK